MECGWLGLVWVLVVLVLEARGQLSRYTGQEALLENWQLQVSPLQDLVGVGVSMCGQRCLQQAGSPSYNYHRASGRCQCLGKTTEDSLHLLVPTEGWFHGNINGLIEAARLPCSCQDHHVCQVKPASVIRCTNVIYNVTIFTGSHSEATTRAEASVSLIGQKGSINDTRFNATDGAFHKNTMDSVVVDGGRLGPLLQLMLQKKTYENDGWFVDKVEVVTLDGDTVEVTTFPAGLWLDGDERSYTNWAILNATESLP